MTAKKRMIDLSSSLEVSQEGTSVRAYFSVLDLSGVGATEDEAKENLVRRINPLLQDDPEARERFEAWAQDHIIEVDEEPGTGGGDDLLERAKQATSGFEELTADNFDQAIASDEPVLVDFWAEWCRPCLMAAPVLAELSQEMPNLRFAKLNTEEHPQLSQRFGIKGIPCFILFRSGEEVGRSVGARPKVELRKEIDRILG